MKTIILLSLSAYAVTFLAVSSSLFAPGRKLIAVKAPWLRVDGHPHMVECRMCTGFWVSLVICLLAGEWQMILPVYGASYFLATQERK